MAQFTVLLEGAEAMIAVLDIGLSVMQKIATGAETEHRLDEDHPRHRAR